jgi:hypothetical protein
MRIEDKEKPAYLLGYAYGRKAAFSSDAVQTRNISATQNQPSLPRISLKSKRKREHIIIE